MIPDERIELLTPHAPRERDYVLYWMIGTRRVRSSFALERAAWWARELGQALVILEPLRVAYPYASDRFHRFIIDGMADNQGRLEDKPVSYYPYVEPEPGAGKGLLEAMAARASVVVTDDQPGFFLRKMVGAAARKLDVRFETIDDGGLIPLRATPKAYPLAHTFRRFVQKEGPSQLAKAPPDDPLSRLAIPRLDSLPRDVTRRWPRVEADTLRDPRKLIASLPIDHSVGEIKERGGWSAAHERLKTYMKNGYRRYPERSHPDEDAQSHLSSWLHFGQIGTYEIIAAMAREEEWTPADISSRVSGSREGFWNMSVAGESMMDELVTWREVGRVRCHHDPEGFASWSGIPEWARQTLEEHLSDPRELVSRDRILRGETGEPVWDAAQRQLLADGRIHNYIRMLWGKLVLAWTRHPQEAFELLVEMNDRFAIDGRDPSGYTNIGWIFGAYDRAWGPERPIYGKVRYMTSDSAQRKLKMKEWLRHWGRR